MLLKTIGAILVIGAAAAVGLSVRGRLSKRVRILQDIVTALDLIHSEIACMCTPLDELLDKLCSAVQTPLRLFFCDCCDGHAKRPDLPVAMIWSRAVRDAEYLELLPQEEQALLDVGNAIGRYEAEEELRVLSHARRTMEGYLKTAEEMRTRLGKLYGSLSLMSGIAVVIMLL